MGDWNRRERECDSWKPDRGYPGGRVRTKWRTERNSGTPNSAGIMLLGGAANNLIAGNADGTGANSIRSNNGKGISLSNGGIAGVGPAGSGNTIRFNQIDDNAGLGIDLANDGVSANDSGDTDTGPNDLQNTAVLSCGNDYARRRAEHRWDFDARRRIRRSRSTTTSHSVVAERTIGTGVLSSRSGVHVTDAVGQCGD